MSSRTCPVKYDLESDFELDFEAGLTQTTAKGESYYAYDLLNLVSEHHKTIWHNKSLGWGEKANFSQPEYPGPHSVALEPTTLLYCTNYASQ